MTRPDLKQLRRRGSSGFVADQEAPPAQPRPTLPPALQPVPPPAEEPGYGTAAPPPPQAHLEQEVQAPVHYGGIMDVMAAMPAQGYGEGFERSEKFTLGTEKPILAFLQDQAGAKGIKVSQLLREILMTPVPDGWWAKVFVARQITPKAYFSNRHKLAGGRAQTTALAPSSVFRKLDQEQKALKEAHGQLAPKTQTELIEALLLIWALRETGRDPMAL